MFVYNRSTARNTVREYSIAYECSCVNRKDEKMFVLSKIISANTKDSDKSREAPKNTGGSGCRTFRKKGDWTLWTPNARISNGLPDRCTVPIAGLWLLPISRGIWQSLNVRDAGRFPCEAIKAGGRMWFCSPYRRIWSEYSPTVFLQYNIYNWILRTTQVCLAETVLS